MPTEAKPFASLSSGLLARKGAARPAMRPQGFGQVGNGLEDLGWDDMGFEPPKAAEAIGLAEIELGVGIAGLGKRPPNRHGARIVRPLPGLDPGLDRLRREGGSHRRRQHRHN